MSSAFFIDDFASMPFDASISRSSAFVFLFNDISFPWLQRLHMNLSKLILRHQVKEGGGGKTKPVKLLLIPLSYFFGKRFGDNLNYY